MIFYLDTSAIVKRYHNELGTEVVDRLFDSRAILATSFYSVLEFSVAFSAKKKRGEIKAEALNFVFARIFEDLHSRFWLIEVDNKIIAESVKLATKYILSSGDLLQLQSALELRELAGDLIFICADADLCKAAEKEGLKAINPRFTGAMKKIEELLDENY